MPTTLKKANAFLFLAVFLSLIVPVSASSMHKSGSMMWSMNVDCSSVFHSCDLNVIQQYPVSTTTWLNGNPGFEYPADDTSGMLNNDVTGDDYPRVNTAEKISPQESVHDWLDSGDYLLNHTGFVTDARAAVDLVYNLEFTRARQRMSVWRDASPDHALWPFWEALELWWTILPDLENTSSDALFIRKLEEADMKADRLLRKDRRSVDGLIIKTLANGFLARLYSNRESWYKSLSHARVSLNVLFRLEEVEPDLADLQFGLGAYNYFAAYLADEYPMVKPLAWMLPAGDRADGLKRLKVASENSAFLIPESTYFLGNINLHFEQEFDTALQYLETMTERYPGNGFFRRLLIRAHLSMGNLEHAGNLIDSTFRTAAFATDIPLLEELSAERARIHYIYSENDKALELSENARRYASRLSNTPNQRRFGAMGTYYAAQTKLRTGEQAGARRYLRDLDNRRNYSFYATRARQTLRSL